MAKLYFQTDKELAWLSSVIHPAVKEWFRGKPSKRSGQRGNCRLFVVEAALLIEDHYEELCEEFWYIAAESGAAERRLKETRGYSDEKIDAIFANQKPDAVFRKHCARVIENNGTKEEVYGQIKKDYTEEKEKQTNENVQYCQRKQRKLYLRGFRPASYSD
ncbi:MAG: dephospho-CoA kinase [Eubacteriales bacterium]